MANIPLLLAAGYASATLIFRISSKFYNILWSNVSEEAYSLDSSSDLTYSLVCWLSSRSISLTTSSGVLYSIAGIPRSRSKTLLSACFPSANLITSSLSIG